MLEKPLREQARLPRRVYADELDFGAIVEAVKEAGVYGRSTGCFFARKTLRKIEIVDQLLAVVARFRFVAVVVAHGRVNRNAIDDVSVGLIESEKPVIVFVARGPHGQPEKGLAGIDVVTGRDDQAHSSFIDGPVERPCYLALSLLRLGRFADAGSKVTQHREGQRGGFLRMGMSPETILVPPAGAHQTLTVRTGNPVAALSVSPNFAIHNDAIGVFRVGREPLNTHLV